MSVFLTVRGDSHMFPFPTWAACCKLSSCMDFLPQAFHRGQKGPGSCGEILACVEVSTTWSIHRRQKQLFAWPHFTFYSHWIKYTNTRESAEETPARMISKMWLLRKGQTNWGCSGYPWDAKAKKGEINYPSTLQGEATHCSLCPWEQDKV